MQFWGFLAFPWKISGYFPDRLPVNFQWADEQAESKSAILGWVKSITKIITVATSFINQHNYLTHNDPHTNDTIGLGLHARNDKKTNAICKNKGWLFYQNKGSFHFILIEFLSIFCNPLIPVNFYLVISYRMHGHSLHQMKYSKEYQQRCTHNSYGQIYQPTN